VQVEDHRGTAFSTETGEAVEYHEFGPLPSTLTQLPRPGPHYVWTGVDWERDAYAEALERLEIERTWRNARIAESDFLVMPDYPLVPEQRTALYEYRQRLRDWPAAVAFPNPGQRPPPPDWMADKLRQE
jgi:hypothetical protein